MDIPESAMVLAYSDQHPAIRQIDSDNRSSTHNRHNDTNHTITSSTSKGATSIHHHVVLSMNGFISILLQLLSIGLLEIGRLPEALQVLYNNYSKQLSSSSSSSS